MSIEARIAVLNTEYIEALMEGDYRWFARHLADEFQCIESDGTMRDKASFVAKVAAGPGFASYQFEQVRVRVYGEAALVQATGRFDHGDGARWTSRYVDVYALHGHHWLVVSAQVTRVPTPAVLTG